MRQSKCILLFLVLGVLLPSCSIFKKKPEPAPAGPKTILIGTIDMVNPEQNYVLIRCDQPLKLPAGTELVGVDAAGGESRLKLTPERKGRYLTADIKEGQPQVSHFVIYRSSGGADPFAATGSGELPLTPPVVAPIPLEPVSAPEPVLDPLLPSADPLPPAPIPAPELEPPVQ